MPCARQIRTCSEVELARRVVAVSRSTIVSLASEAAKSMRVLSSRDQTASSAETCATATARNE